MAEKKNDPLNPEKEVLDPEEIEKALKAVEDGKEAREVNISCRRTSHVEGRPGAATNSDADIVGPKCDSNRAVVISDLMPNVSQTMYRCVDCGYSWGVSMGGYFPY